MEALKIPVSKRIVVLLLFISFPGFSYAANMNVVGTISGINGKVEIRKAGGDGWRAAEEGGKLAAGDRVRSGEKGSCVITWLKGNTVKLSSFTNLEITRLDMDPGAGSENAQLDLSTGRIHAKTGKRASQASSFEVKTPTAVAGVRGTQLAVTIGDDESTLVECLSGVVQVKGLAGGEVMLGEKQKVRVRMNEKPGKAEAMDNAEIDAFEGVETIAAPILDVSQPIGNFETDNALILVKGLTNPNNQVTILVEELEYEQTAVAGGDGLFTATLNLAPGVNHIKFTALNKQGKSAAKTRTVKLKSSESESVIPDTEPPVLIVSQPQSSFTVDGSICARAGDSIQCVVSGVTEPGAKLIINNTLIIVGPDGSFSQTITLGKYDLDIQVSAEDAASNRATSVIRRIPSDVETLDVIVTPAQIVANGQNTAAVSVTAKSFLGQALSGKTVTFSVSGGGSVSPASAVTDASGAAATTFTAGVSAVELTTITITAASGGVSGAAALNLQGDFPPAP